MSSSGYKIFISSGPNMIHILISTVPIGEKTKYHVLLGHRLWKIDNHVYMIDEGRAQEISKKLFDYINDKFTMRNVYDVVGTHCQVIKYI